MLDSYSYIIIGAGLLGASAVEGIRDRDQQGRRSEGRAAGRHDGGGRNRGLLQGRQLRGRLPKEY